MLAGWRKGDIAQNITILDPYAEKIVAPDLLYIDSVKKIPKELDVLVLAVKPQNLPEICESLKGKIQDTLPVLSIAAGKNLAFFAHYFPENQPLIRAMPNTPGAIGKGITAVLKTPNLSKAHKALAETLISSLGVIVWVQDESQMDAITALSGSGPAYIFYLIESLSQAGEAAGLPKDTALKLARQTVIGAAALAEQQPMKSAAALREAVTSKGGTTEAGLNILMDGRFDNVIKETIKAAQARSKELSK